MNIISNQRTSDSMKEQEMHSMKMKLEALEKVVESMRAQRPVKAKA